MLHSGKRYDLANDTNEIYRFLVFKAPELDSIKHKPTATLKNGMAIPVNTTITIFMTVNSVKDYVRITAKFNRLMKEG